MGGNPAAFAARPAGSRRVDDWRVISGIMGMLRSGGAARYVNVIAQGLDRERFK